LSLLQSGNSVQITHAPLSKTKVKKSKQRKAQENLNLCIASTSGTL